MRVSLLIPAYNEEENLPELMQEIDRFLRETGEDWEVVLVDDGSTDHTYEVARRLAERYPFLKVVRHRRNLGVTDALITGARHATGEVFIFFPADLQHLPEDAHKLVQKIREGYDLVTGWKQGKYEKKFVSGVYNWLSRVLFRVPVHDLNSIKAMRREMFFDLPLRRDWHRYIVPLAHDRGYRITEVKVPLYPRRHGESKFKGPKRVIIGLLDLLAVKFQLTFMRKPMLFFGSLGLLSFLLGFLAGLVALYLRFVRHLGYRPILYLVVLLVLAGIILFVAGFLGELIAGLYDEIQRLRREETGRRESTEA